MKILHVTPSYYPAVRHGGPILSMREIDRALCACGASVDVITTNTHQRDALDVPLGIWVDDGYGVRIQYAPRIGRSMYSFSPKQFEFLIREHKRYDAFYISSLFTFSTAAFSLWARATKPRYWVSPRAAMNLSKRAALKKLHLALFEESLYKSAQFIHVTSIQEESELRSVGLGPNFLLVPNAPNEVSSLWPESVTLICAAEGQQSLSTSSFLQSLGRFRFFYFGTISPLKNIDTLIEAFGNVSSGRDASLVLIGPDYRGERARLLRKYASLGPSVVFIDRMDTAEIQAIASQLGISVHASLGENFSNSLIEVSNLKLPAVVSSEIGALEFVSRHGIIVFDPLVKGDLACALEHAFANYDTLRVDAKERKINLPTWKDCGRALVDAINRKW
jgi:glycosyltransferase involved in cell wall biosynthesis